jgi:hypothetical protein
MAHGIVQVVNLVDTDVHGSPTRPARFACKIPRASRAMIKHECFAANLDFARTITHPKMGLKPLVFHYLNSAPLNGFFRRRVAPENEGPEVPVSVFGEPGIRQCKAPPRGLNSSWSARPRLWT